MSVRRCWFIVFVVAGVFVVLVVLVLCDGLCVSVWVCVFFCVCGDGRERERVGGGERYMWLRDSSARVEPWDGVRERLMGVCLCVVCCKLWVVRCVVCYLLCVVFVLTCEWVVSCVVCCVL